MSKDREQIIDKLMEHIRARDFCLDDTALEEIDASYNDELVSGWVFTYRAYASTEQKRNEMLKANISNSNPRIREQVCDIIGDEFIGELRDILKQLFNDPIDYVSSAARYNHDEMF
ncbi:hypothetical protein ACJJIF_21320 [Microbulbifer sp. SSSA002]|uniref:hypothetical protein n=1 Tax=unclassified Microbulbifer TaxID=2619833 RepID=UPI0040399C23